MNRLNALMLITSLISGTAFAETINFDDATPGAAPGGWTATKTGEGEAKWAIAKDATAPSKPNVLKQSGEATSPVALKDDTSLKDGFVEVKFKAISGEEDQAGGVIWRAKAANQWHTLRVKFSGNRLSGYRGYRRCAPRPPANFWQPSGLRRS